MLSGRLWSTAGAVLLSTLIAFMAVGVLPCPKIANAQSVPPSDEVLNERQVREFRSYLDKTKSADELTRSRWQRMVSRNLPKAAPALGGSLVAGGLFTAAAGIWYHNYVTFKTGYLDTLGSDALPYDVEFQPPSGVKSWSYSYDGYLWTKNAIVKASGGYVSISSTVQRETCCVARYYNLTYWSDGGTFYSSGSSTFSGGSPNTYYGSQVGADRGSLLGKTWMHQFGNGTSATEYHIHPGNGESTIIIGDGYDMTNKYQTGQAQQAPPEYQPASGDYVATPAETKTLYDLLRQDPEYEPASDDLPSDETSKQRHERRVGELAPEHGAEQWTTANPDGSYTTRFADGTELTTWPDGTEMIRRADGTETWKYPDGTTRQYDPATGTETTTWPDGTTRTRTPGQPDQWTDPGGASRTAPSPTEYPEPPAHAPPTPGGTSQGSSTCSQPYQHVWATPELQVDDRFPFSLVIRFWRTFEDLAAPPNAPSVNLPFFGAVEMGAGMHSMVQNIRTVFGLIFGAGMAIWFYRYVSGKGNDNG